MGYPAGIFMKETELVKGVIAWLQDMKWDVYQEVQVFSYGAIADIVGLFNGSPQE